MSLSFIKKISTVILIFTLSSVAFGNEFSIEQEYKVRRLADFYNKKYGMKIKVKRSKGSLLVKVWDQAAFTQDSKITETGARFFKKISQYLCYQEDQCEVELTSHHSEGGYISRNLTVKKSQYKMTSVALQILKAKIDPRSLTQKALGDSQPLADLEKNRSASGAEVINMNTRIELKFLPKKGRI